MIKCLLLILRDHLTELIETDIEPVFEALRALTNLASMDEPTRIAIAGIYIF